MLVAANNGDFEFHSKSEIISFVKSLSYEDGEIWISGNEHTLV